MPEPISHSAATLTGASSATLTASALFGTEYLIASLAFIGGATALIYAEKMDWKRMATSVVGSTILGFTFSHMLSAAAADTAVHYWPWLKDSIASSYQSMQLLIAFLVGFLALKGVPLLFRYMDRIGGK